MKELEDKYTSLHFKIILFYKRLSYFSCKKPRAITERLGTLTRKYEDLVTNKWLKRQTHVTLT